VTDYPNPTPNFFEVLFQKVKEPPLRTRAVRVCWVSRRPVPETGTALQLTEAHRPQAGTTIFERRVMCYEP
jgi:hypothetical protein